ncbi:MAG TPA: hypothetical protein VGS27_36620 [Candidatus Sulfotelmatobacter sp.]|nr:hypothetical protein [Candidatus Sulfotelmatobacter sp.]
MTFHSFTLVYSEHFTIPSQSPLICDLCDRPVPIERAQTDEYGQPVHESCYVAAVKSRRVGA